MGDELNTGAEQVVMDTPTDAGAVQADEQTANDGEPGSSQNLPTAGVDKETEFRQLQGEYTRARQELAAWKKTGKTPEEVAAILQSQATGQQIYEALQKLAGGNQSPDDNLPPELRDNPIFTDPEYAYIRQAVEHLAEQRIKPLAEAQQQRERAETIQAAQSACQEFVNANPELGLTVEQLYQTCVDKRHNPFTQLTQAAIDAVGGFQKFSDLQFKKRLDAYQKQAVENRRKSGTVVAPNAPVGTSPEAPMDRDEHFNWIVERARQNAALRMGSG